MENASFFTDLNRRHGTDTPPYILTNESSLDQTRAILQKEPRPENSLHVGTSGWHNYDIMWIRRSSFGCLFDISSCVMELHILTKKFLAESKNRLEFIEKITTHLAKNPIRGLLKK